MKKFLFLIFVLFTFIFSGCIKKDEIYFSFPNNNPLAYVPGKEWAVIKEPLVGLRETDSYESKVLNHVRRGDVLEVSGKRISTKKNADGKKVSSVWYGFEKGWVESSAVTIYENRMQAENASQKMNKN
ncbi:MAG: hypothetical protein K6G00_12180 [Treponema sp.]|nr:hypothetical protein [Treponema sp.]